MKILENVNLSEILWYKIGGTARYVLQAENADDVKKAIDFIKKEKLKRAFFLGQGSNLIFTD